MSRLLPLLLLCLSIRSAFACSCGYLSECELRTLPVVFIGKVVGGGVTIRDDPWYKDTGSVRFEIVEAIRGIKTGTKFVDIETRLWPGMCSFNPYRLGRTYVVAPRDADGHLSDGICFSGRDIEEVPEMVKFLRNDKEHPSQSYLRGTVHTGEAWPAPKPRSGARVSVTLGNGKKLTAATNARGFYELPVPGPGRYRVEVASPPYPAATAEIEIPDDGNSCLARTFALLSNSSISGHVRDSSGKVLAHAGVALIDVDDPVDKRGLPKHYREMSASDGGAVTFENVPLGRYYLVFHPEGPTEPPYGIPFEPAFFPGGGSSRAKAQILIIDSPGKKLVNQNIVVSTTESTRFRTVKVTARFQDGSPMKTAEVLVVGDPLEPGGLPWIRRSMVRNTEDAPYSMRHARNVRELYSSSREFLGLSSVEASIRVPVNRSFRIVVRDAYGRDLGKVYESTHPAGSTPVVQDFRIDSR